MTLQSRSLLTPVAAAVAAALSPGQAVHAQDAAKPAVKTLDEITVTARKRSESVQDVPIAIQALSQDTLAAMGAKAMEDYARFIPSVAVVTYSASSNVVVFRGAITSPGYIAASTSSVYLDEISITTTGSQPNVRMVDIARVEALSGPQGTLYGSDAQAGTMRIVTNKPDASGFEAIFDGEVRGGSDSDMSYRGSLVLNLPLVEDQVALRLVGYNDHDGGFIDNVYGHTADESFFGQPYPADSGTLDNSASVESAWNDADIVGGRASLLWNLNDAWSADISASFQNTDMGADNYYDPYVGDLQTVRFHDEWTEDQFSLFSLTLEGDLGFAQLVSATSYFDRTNEYLTDVTTYAHYWTALYCVDSGTPADPDFYVLNPDTGNAIWWPVYCTGTTADSETLNAHFVNNQMDKFTQELRLSSQGDTIDWIVGLFYETTNDDFQSSFAVPTMGGDGSVHLYQQSLALQQYEIWAGESYPLATSGWYSASQTDWEQKAVFGELTWHINDQMDLTFGGRYYDRSNTNYYFVNRPGALEMPDPFVPPEARVGTDREFIPKIALNYSFESGADSRMVYGLFTRGKRPGGINRQRGEPFFPGTYVSDLMDNYEFGYKSTFGSGAGRFNVTAYHMLWKDYQHELTDPSSIDCIRLDPPLPDAEIPGVCGQPWQRVVANLGEAHMTGVNIEVDMAVGDNWVLGMNAEFMEAETDTEHDLNADGIPDLLGGLRLPLVPKFKAAAWAEYRWPIQFLGNNNAFLRTQWSYSGDSVSIIEPISPDDSANPQFINEAYVIGDLRFGISADDWEASIFVNNLTDERAQFTHNDGQWEYGASNVAEGRAHTQRIFTNRPLEVGVRFMKRWGD